MARSTVRGRMAVRRWCAAAAVAAGALLAPGRVQAQDGGVVRAAGALGWYAFKAVCVSGGTLPGGVTFVAGPAQPAQGSGSAEFQASVGAFEGLRQDALAGTLLADIASLRYSTFTWGGSPAGAAPYLTLWVDLNGDGTGDDYLMFVPVFQSGYTNAVPAQGPWAAGQWQTWEAATGGWWSASGLAGTGPAAGVKTLAQYAAQNPGARLAAQAGLTVGLGCRPEIAGSSQALTGYVDFLAVTTPQTTRLWNFEPPASAPAQQTAPVGAVLQLSGTPHLWIADDQGILHWGGDTRALAGRTIRWDTQRQVGADQLRSFRIGDPWLSSGLLKLGDPIYLVKWETSETQPRLFHIQSIADVELFGINATNYGTFVLERAAWERQFSFNVDTLARLELAAAAGPAATPTPVASPLRAREVSVRKVEDPRTYETTIEVTGARPGRRLTVTLINEEWICSPGCDTTRRDAWGPLDAGPADPTGKLVYRDRHSAYRSYTYTFADPDGNSTSITFGNDLGR